MAGIELSPDCARVAGCLIERCSVTTGRLTAPALGRAPSEQQQAGTLERLIFTTPCYKIMSHQRLGRRRRAARPGCVVETSLNQCSRVALSTGVSATHPGPAGSLSLPLSFLFCFSFSHLGVFTCTSDFRLPIILFKPSHIFFLSFFARRFSYILVLIRFWFATELCRSPSHRYSSLSLVLSLTLL